MKTLFTGFHMLYCLSKYCLRYDRLTIGYWELSPGQFPAPASPVSILEEQSLSYQSDNSHADCCV